jgi:SAM-dependent methyltransferase
MPIPTIQHAGRKYPAFQASGNAARFVIPFAQEVCIGVGFDIGCNRLEWKLPNALPVDPVIDCKHDAFTLPNIKVDYIFSSHCLEHLHSWVEALDHWATRLRAGGVLFLYLPHPDQSYWWPWNNRKHIHVLYPQMIEQYLIDRGWRNVFVSQRDLNHSYVVMAEKSEI